MPICSGVQYFLKMHNNANVTYCIEILFLMRNFFSGKIIILSIIYKYDHHLYRRPMFLSCIVTTLVF